MEAVCDLCGDCRFEELLNETRLWKVPTGRRMVRCYRCNLVQIVPRTDPMVVDYSQEDYFASCLDFQEGAARYSARISLFRRRLQEIDRYREPGRLLDVGCAKGDFLRLARDEFGWDVVGLDVSAWAAEYACSTYDLDVQVASVADALFRQAEFDVIHANHVLEHVSAPLTALQRMWQWLRPGGCLFLEVPNEIDNLPWHLDLLLGRTRAEDGPFGRRKPRPQSTPHLYFFTRKTLARILESASFEVAALRTRTDTTWRTIYPGTTFPVKAQVKIAAFRLACVIGQWMGRGSNIVAVAARPDSTRL